ncbi:MAG: methyltransferase domain-containing protein [Chloroflexi bacterium]|nr:methyltransferase domain-containing protein [Chloroflexota bacterium]
MADHKNIVRQQFGTRAERYVKSVDHRAGESLDRLIELTRPQPSWRALDVATGGGHTALAVSRFVAEVVAADITPEMLIAAGKFIAGQGQTNVAFREADAMALPFGDAGFDLVTCRLAPHHFADVGRFVRECARVVKPGGAVAVIDNTVPNDPQAAQYINDFEKLRDPSHQREYSLEAWIGFFEAAGLTVEAAEAFRKPIGFDSWADRMDVPPEMKARLKVMLLDAPEAAREWLTPEGEGAELKFYLGEGLVIGRRLAVAG